MPFFSGEGQITRLRDYEFTEATYLGASSRLRDYEITLDCLASAHWEHKSKPQTGQWNLKVDMLLSIKSFETQYEHMCLIMFSGILLEFIITSRYRCLQVFFLVSETKGMIKHQKWTHRKILSLRQEIL